MEIDDELSLSGNSAVSVDGCATALSTYDCSDDDNNNYNNSAFFTPQGMKGFSSSSGGSGGWHFGTSSVLTQY